MAAQLGSSGLQFAPTGGRQMLGSSSRYLHDGHRRSQRRSARNVNVLVKSVQAGVQEKRLADLPSPLCHENNFDEHGEKA